MWVKLHICNKLLFLEVTSPPDLTLTDRPKGWWERDDFCAPNKEVVSGWCIQSAIKLGQSLWK